MTGTPRLPRRRRGAAALASLACSLIAAAPPGARTAVDHQSGSCVRHRAPAASAARETAAAGERGHRAGQPAAGTRIPRHVTIPVHWNVISADATYRGGNVPGWMIARQMEVLNEDFADTGVSFATAGVRRVREADWFHQVEAETAEPRRTMESRLRVGGPETLSIYSVDLPDAQRTGLFGAATLPAAYRKDPVEDGVLVSYRALPGGDAPGHGLGRALTHQTGHWVGLYDTFEGGCREPGDHVADTAPEATRATGCPPARDTCPLPGDDPVHNFMDTSDDACRHVFTPGQVRRMRGELARHRHAGV